MKNVDYKLIKLTNNLPKYDLGKMATDSTGFQQDLNPVSQGTIINPGEDLSSMATGERQARIAGVTSDSLKLGTNLISKIPTQAAIDASKNGLIRQGTGALGKASGAMKGLAAAGIATGVLEAGMGAVDVAKASNQMRNAYSPDEIQSWTGSQTGYGIGNNVYELKTLDAANATNVINQRLKSASAGLTTGSASVGSGVGTAVGSALALGNVGAGTAMGAWLGPIGAAAGAVLGGLFGWIGGSVRRRKQEQAAREEIARQETGISNFNKQAVSEANSLGMRQEYDAKFNRLTNGGMATAWEGKQPGTIFNKYANKQYVNTAYGVQYREPNAITNGNELIIDTKTGFASDVLGDGKENKATFVRPQDAIINSKYADIARWAIATQNGPLLNNVITQQGIDMNRKEKGELVRYACGKMPKYAVGKTPDYKNTITGISPIIPDFRSYTYDEYAGPEGNLAYMGKPWKFDLFDLTDKWGGMYEATAGEKGPVYTRNYKKPKELLAAYNEKYPGANGGSSFNMSDWATSIISGANLLANEAMVGPQYKRIQNEDTRGFDPTVLSNAPGIYAQNAKFRPDYSVFPMLDNSARRSLYSLRNNGAMTNGQKTVLADSIMRGLMNAKENAFNNIQQNKYNWLNQYAAQLAGLHANEAQRWTAGRQYADTSSNQKKSEKNNMLLSLLNTRVGSRNTFAHDINTNVWTNKNIALYDRKLNNDRLKIERGIA